MSSCAFTAQIARIDAEITASEDVGMEVFLKPVKPKLFLSLSSDLLVMYIVIRCLLPFFIFQTFTITYPAKLEVRHKEME